MTVMRVVIVVAALGALVGLFLALRPDDDDGEASPPTATTTATVAPNPAPTETAPTPTETQAPPKPKIARALIVVRGGEPIGGIRRLSMRKDRWLILVVRSDVADHVHVHGYDIMRDVAPGAPARFDLRTTIVGRFEIELEDRGKQIAQLTVAP
jgi:hypothetical protein